MLVGNGFDIHKHSNDEKLVLGGISVEGPGFEAHSDGDIVLHLSLIHISEPTRP